MLWVTFAYGKQKDVSTGGGEKSGLSRICEKKDKLTVFLWEKSFFVPFEYTINEKQFTEHAVKMFFKKYKINWHCYVLFLGNW